MLNFINQLAHVIYQLLDDKNIISKKTVHNLMQLNPGESERDLKRKYSVKKIRYALLIIFIGSIFALILWISDKNSSSLVDGLSICRNDAGRGKKEVTLSAIGENGKKVNISLTVQDYSYSNEEILKLYNDFIHKISIMALNQNESWDSISTDLNLIDRIDGYPFIIEWKSGDTMYLSDDGLILNNTDKEDNRLKEQKIDLHMKVTYRSFIKEHIFQATVIQKPEKKTFRDTVQIMAEQIENNTLTQKVFRLPQYVDGEKIEWSEVSENKSLSILLVSMVAVVSIWVINDRQVAKQVEKKRQLVDGEYQAIISKLTLYLGAGMNLTGAWFKVATEGSNNPIYEEMLITCREMEGGVSEKEAYEHFAKRVRQQHYVKLVTYLVQNLQKGNTEILVLLKQESLLAMENYHAFAKKRGEEMGTKLLLPMVLMLGMVMVLIIVPVFLSM